MGYDFCAMAGEWHLTQIDKKSRDFLQFFAF